MCKDITHNKGKSVRKQNCAMCNPSLICKHGLRTCNKCGPGITEKNNQITRHKKERETFHGHTAVQLLDLTLDEQKALSTDFMYLKDKAIIESSAEEKRKVIRNVKKQVELLSCNLLTYGLRSDQSLFGAIQGSDFS
jgi:hypothetical protein